MVAKGSIFSMAMSVNVLQTKVGAVQILEREALFAEFARLIGALAEELPGASIAMTGGSTPKAFYQWAVGNNVFVADALGELCWTVSDERLVPEGSTESNWGNLRRGLLEPLVGTSSSWLPWNTALPADEAAADYTARWQQRFGADASYDLCVLGMGDDCHTASLFPGCPLLENDGNASFAATHWPGRGGRLTITPTGLMRCRQVVLLVTGAAKAKALREVVREPLEPLSRPAQVLAALAQRVTWLVDTEAASLIAG